jgi:cell division protein FtsW
MARLEFGRGEGIYLAGCVAHALYTPLVRRLNRGESPVVFSLGTLLAGAGLVSLLGGQAFINMLVNLQLFPSKGMTLPLVSYGGSSTIAIGLTVGLLLAVTRRNPFLKSRTKGLGEWMGIGQADAMNSPSARPVREIQP